VRVLVVMRVGVHVHGAVGVAMLVGVGVTMLVRMDMMRGLGGLTRAVGFAVNHDINFGGGYATTIDARDLQLGTEVERLHGLAEQVGRDAGVDERAEEHVSADARETLNVSNTHEGENRSSEIPLPRAGRGMESFIVGQCAAWGQTARFVTIAVSSAI
jgi:hypothetical protein